MPGTYMKPKAYNRHFALNLGTDASPDWAEISVGISSRGNSFTENTEDFYYMNNKGTAETEPTNQKISRTFSGNRFIGDKAQDAVFIDRLYDLDNREAEYLEWYDNYPEGKANGYKGKCALTVSDDGSGDTSSRETIGFGFSINGKPVAGTVTVTEEGKITFAEKV